MFCSTDLCLSVDKLKKEKKKEQCQCAEVSADVVYILSTENTYIHTHTPENTHTHPHAEINTHLSTHTN